MIKSLLGMSFCMCFCLSVWASPSPVTDEELVEMAQDTAADLADDAARTIDAINTGDPLYWFEKDSDSYVFVLDQDVNMVAHRWTGARGKSYKEMKDLNGKTFALDFVKGAVDNGFVWDQFVRGGYIGDPQKQVTRRVYSLFVTGSDNKGYIVCAGKNLD